MLACHFPLFLALWGGAEVQDQNGDWHPLTPISLEDIRKQGVGQEDYQETDGLPNEYEKRGNVIVLYPAPDNGVSVTLSNGLKVFYMRTASVITDITDTTTDLGLPSPFVDVVAYEAALPKAIADGLRNINQLRAERDFKEKELFKFISRRNRDTRPIMSNRAINHI